MMETKENFWHWYERFWIIWAVFMGIMVTSRLLRGQGLYYFNSTMIGNVMSDVVQILCVLFTGIFCFSSLQNLFIKERRKDNV